MVKKCRWLPLAALLAGLALVLVSGCSKYDGLERNMQYVSDELLRKDAEAAWEGLTVTYDQWRAAGFSKDKDNAALAAYQDAYARYAVVYNELLDRKGGPVTGRLRGATDALPPAPPGVTVRPPAAAPASAPTPAPEAKPTAPEARELKNDAASRATPAEPRKRAAEASTEEGTSLGSRQTVAAAASGENYVIRPGDSLRVIAKRHGVSEKKLLEANGLSDPDKLAAGKTLVIPAR
jgi:LysM repeat protein